MAGSFIAESFVMETAVAIELEIRNA